MLFGISLFNKLLDGFNDVITDSSFLEEKEFHHTEEFSSVGVSNSAAGFNSTVNGQLLARILGSVKLLNVRTPFSLYRPPNPAGQAIPRVLPE